MTLPLLIDTDPGIDDALALLLALRSPECSVEAITTVAGNVPVERCTLNALRVLEAVGPRRYPKPRVSLSPLDGPDLILDTIDRFPGELVVVAIGPLTNLALALQRDPRRMAQVRRVGVLGGAGGVPGNVTPVAEFNFYVDPEAAAQVLASGLPIELVPLDVTRNASLPPAVPQPRLAARARPASRVLADPTPRGGPFGGGS